MQRVLVTGGSGFVGRNLQKVKPEWKYLSSSGCDLLHIENITKIIKHYEPTAILHLAGIVGGIKENSIKQGKRHLESRERSQ